MRIRSSASPKTRVSALGTSRTEHVDLCPCLKDRIACVGKAVPLVWWEWTLPFHFTRDEMVCGVTRNQNTLIPALSPRLALHPFLKDLLSKRVLSMRLWVSSAGCWSAEKYMFFHQKPPKLLSCAQCLKYWILGSVAGTSSGALDPAPAVPWDSRHPELCTSLKPAPGSLRCHRDPPLQPVISAVSRAV